MALSTTYKNLVRSVNLGTDAELSLACEIYEPDVLPGADGFDPVDALDCFAGTTLTFRTRTYKRLVAKWGQISKPAGETFGSASLTLSNIDKYISALILAQPLASFEGYILVVRIIARGVSVNLNDTHQWFSGKIDKVGDISREDFPISAKGYLDSLDIELPRRKFTATDPEGRAANDPLSEGFPFVPTTGTLTITTRERRTDLLGLFGLKKNVTKNLPYSSHSAIDANRSVPIIFGRVQMLGIHIGFADVGNSIPMLTAWADGVRYGIWKYENLRKVSPGFTELVTLGAAPTYRYGLPGGTGAGFQEPVTPGSAADRIGNNYYSRTAWTYTFVNGSQVDQDDPAPDLASVIYGCLMPTPDDAGVFNQIKFTDNPAYITRFILTDPYLMGLPEEFIDDAICWDTGKWCDQYIEDYIQTDTVLLPDEQIPFAGVNYHLYKSTGIITPDHFKAMMGEAVNPYHQEADYNFYSVPQAPEVPGGPPGFPEPPILPDPVTPRFSLRRRYTCNVPVTEPQKAWDFLNNVVFAATGLYVTQGSNGKVQIRVKRPVDSTLVRQDTAAGVTEIPVNSVLAWLSSLDGKILIGANLLTSEIRRPTGWRYTTAGNAITLAVTGAATASGATFSGGNNTTTPATANVTFSGTGAVSVTIDGITLEHHSFGSDTADTLGGWFAAAVNAHPTLGLYVRADWNTEINPNVLTLQAKLGFLQFTEPLEEDHDAAEEVLRISASFATGARLASDLTRSNILDNSTRWTPNIRQSSYNVIDLSYRDASQDWRYTTLRVRDDTHIEQVGKRLTKEVNGAAIDNYSQAQRRANQLLAELRSPVYVQHASDGEALLVEEGHVICVNTPEFANLPLYVESVGLRYDGHPSVAFSGRRYLNSDFSDTAEERTIPLPTFLSYINLPPPVGTDLVLEEVGSYGPDYSWDARVRGIFDFGEYAGPQFARVFLKRPGDSDWRDTNNLVRPDENNQGIFEIDVAAGEHEVKVVIENRYGDKAASGHPEETIDVVGLAPAPIAPTTFTLEYHPVPNLIIGYWPASVSNDILQYEIYTMPTAGGTETFYTAVTANYFEFPPPPTWNSELWFKVYARSWSQIQSVIGRVASISPPVMPELGVTWTQTGSLRTFTIEEPTGDDRHNVKNYSVHAVTGGSDILLYAGPDRVFTVDISNWSLTDVYKARYVVYAIDRFGNYTQSSEIEWDDAGTEPDPDPGGIAPVIAIDTLLSGSNVAVVQVAPDGDVNPLDIAYTYVQTRAVGGSWPSTSMHTNGQTVLKGYQPEVLVPGFPGQELEIRVILETFGELDTTSNTVTYRFTDPNYVLEFDGGYQSVDFGVFWSDSTHDYKKFATEFWCCPLDAAGAAYMLSDGYGGIHAQLLGWSGLDASGRLTPILQIFDGTGAVYCFGDDGPFPGEPCHMMYSYDSIHLLIHYNGIPVGKTAFAGTRKTGGVGTGSGALLLGGSDHLNFKGWISQFRMWEDDLNPYAFNNGITYLPAPVSPLRQVFNEEGNPTMLVSFLRPGGVAVDMAGNRTGALRGTHAGYFTGGYTYPFPQPKIALENPVARTTTQPLSTTLALLDTPPATPGSALIFDSFSRRNVTFAYPFHNELAFPASYTRDMNIGTTEAGSQGVKTWQQGSVAAVVAFFGILNGKIVELTNISDSVFWVNTGYASAMTVTMDRTNGSYGMGVDTSIAFRVQDRENFWYAYTHTNGTKMNLGRFVAGVRTAVATDVAVASGWTTLKVRTDPSSGDIEVWRDSTSIYGPTAHAQLKTAQGAGGYYDISGRSLDYRWDNFTCLP